MNREREGTGPVFGAGLLLTAFAVLCLTALTLLSLATAQAEKRMADAVCDSISACYAADLKAEELFARLRAGELPPQVQVRDTIYSYRCPISAHQYLAVVLERREEGWSVCRWQTVTEEQPIDDRLPVWGAEEDTP